MLEIGTRVFHKKSKQNGYISDMWNPHVVNPHVYKETSPMGYDVVTEDGVHHTCLEEDFEIKQ